MLLPLLWLATEQAWPIKTPGNVSLSNIALSKKEREARLKKLPVKVQKAIKVAVVIDDSKEREARLQRELNAIDAKFIAMYRDYLEQARADYEAERSAYLDEQLIIASRLLRQREEDDELVLLLLLSEL